MKLNHKILLVGIATAVAVGACTSSKINPTHSDPRDGQAVFPAILPERSVASVTDGQFFKEFNAIGAAEKEIDSDLNREVKTKLDAILKKRLVLVMGWVRSNPIQLFSELREKQPVLTLEAIPIKHPAHPSVTTVLVTKNKDVVEILNQPKLFSVMDYKNKIQDSVGPFMLASDLEKINFEEKPWMREMMSLEDLPKVKKIVHELVDQAIKDGTLFGTEPDGTPYGRLEVVNAVARRVPILLTGKYFGFPGPNEAKMYEWSHATQDDFFHNVKNIAAVHDLSVKAGQEMQAYLRVLMEQKKQLLSQDPSQDDVLTRMLRRGHGEVFTDDQIRRNIMGTLVGGVETTQAAVVQSLDVMLKHPDILAAAQKAARSGNDKLLSKFVWEALRFNPVNPFVVRMAEQDYTIRGVTIKKGSVVLVATQSAMFDEEVVDHPNDFKLDRPDTVYFHLGYGHHRCLGDYVSLVQVPEIVKGLLNMPGIRVAPGKLGQIQKTEGTASFPEQWVLETSADANAKAPIMAGVDPQYAFEAYLQDFDRHEFRVCMRGEIDSAPLRVASNAVRHYVADYHKRLLYCRLKPAFRTCVEHAQLTQGFLIVDESKRHEEAMVSCKKQGLTDAEETFYRAVMLGQSYDITKIPTDQAHRTSGPDYEFEDHLKFYDRYRYSECFMSPFAPSSFPNDRDMVFYARLPMAFRDCMGIPAKTYEVTEGKLGKSRADQFQTCKNGTYNKDTKRIGGVLTREERFYYQTLILKQNVKYSDIEKETP